MNVPVIEPVHAILSSVVDDEIAAIQILVVRKDESFICALTQVLFNPDELI